MRKRRQFAAAAGAILGLVLALAIAPRLGAKAAPDQLPGFAAEHKFDPSVSVLRLMLFAALPLVGGAVGSRLARRAPQRRIPQRHAPESDARPCVAGWRPKVLLPAAAAHALSVWIFLVVPLGYRGVAPLLLLGILVLAALGLAAVLGKGDPEDGAPYLGAACAILPLAFLGPKPLSWGVAAGVAGLALPTLARACASVRPGITRVARALTLVILLPGSVTALAAAAVMRAPRTADVFEDGHALLPASEYLRGERPYRDIVPGHGLVSDGLLAAAQLKVFGDDYAGLKRGEKVSGLFFWPSFYALGLGATGSPAFGFGGLLLSFLFFPQYQNPRLIASLWTLALALYASRTKKPGAWIACGSALPVGLCIAVEFAAYAAGGVAVALWVARGRRRAHLRRLCLGALVSGGAIAAALAGLGILGGFARATFLFLPSLLPVYALGFAPAPFPRDAAGLAAAMRDETVLLYGFVALSVLLLGTFLPRAPTVGPRARAMLPVCAWAVLAMLSVLERQHVGYGFEVVPIGLLLVARWIRGSRGWTSPRAFGPLAALAWLAGLRHPLVLMILIGDAIANPRPAAGTAPLDQPPRARGAVFRPADAHLVRATAEAIARAGLAPGDTWLDFANAPGLYYLFDRDCPIRYYEVGFYESESAQREVIASVESNPRVRAVLVNAGFGAIDGVPNAKRAPLVAAFVRERFRPFYRNGEVEFWLAKERGSVSSGRPEASRPSPP